MIQFLILDNLRLNYPSQELINSVYRHYWRTQNLSFLYSNKLTTSVVFGPYFCMRVSWKRSSTFFSYLGNKISMLGSPSFLSCQAFHLEYINESSSLTTLFPSPAFWNFLDSLYACPMSSIFHKYLHWMQFFLDRVIWSENPIISTSLLNSLFWHVKIVHMHPTYLLHSLQCLWSCMY